MARILLGVSGGIAAYKAVELVRLATAAGHSVRVIQTPASLKFVGRAHLRGRDRRARAGRGVRARSRPRRLPGRPGIRPQPDLPPRAGGARRRVRDRAGVGQHAGEAGRAGMADNLLTSAALANTAPLVLAPAMNNRMYEHPATRANLELLRSRGAHVVDPGTGRLASKGEWGVGRLAEPAEILAAAEAAIASTQRPAATPTVTRRTSRARDRRRDPRADRLGALHRATARPAGWASRSPRRPRGAARM